MWPGGNDVLTCQRSAGGWPVFGGPFAHVCASPDVAHLEDGNGCREAGLPGDHQDPLAADPEQHGYLGGAHELSSPRERSRTEARNRRHVVI